MGVKRIIDLETLGSISEGDYIPVDNETGGTKKYPANALGGSGTDTALRASTAADYDPTRTYEEGEYCLRNGQLYECTTAITQAEAWNASHWTARTVGGQLETLKSDLNSKLSSNQGSGNAGKWLTIANDGTVTAASLPVYNGGISIS